MSSAAQQPVPEAKSPSTAAKPANHAERGAPEEPRPRASAKLGEGALFVTPSPSRRRLVAIPDHRLLVVGTAGAHLDRPLTHGAFGRASDLVRLGARASRHVRRLHLQTGVRVVAGVADPHAARAGTLATTG